jgi:type I restriction enzyme S subunit
MDKKNVPKIRFKKYHSEWIKSTLEREAEFNPKAELPDIFEYVDLESVSGTELLAHRTEFKGKAPSRAQRLAKSGDLFYQTVRPYQKNNYLFDLTKSNFVFSTGYAQLRPKNDGYFLFSLIQNDLFVRDVLNSCTGTSYPSINSTDLAKIEISSPVEESEYRNIGNTFKNIDTLVSLHSKKYEKLLKIKRAMLEKMFPKDGAKIPEMRFKGFTKPWVLHSFGKIAESISYGLNAAATKFDGLNKYIRITDIDDVTRTFLDKDTTSPKTDLNKANNYILKEGDLLFARTGASVGKTYLYRKNDGVVYFAGFLIRARIKSSFDPEFVFQNTLTGHYFNFIRLTSQRSGQPGVNAQEYSEYSILLPTQDEQQKIGSYLKYLDELISLQSAELEKLKNIKKAMLERMFV